MARGLHYQSSMILTLSNPATGKLLGLICALMLCVSAVPASAQRPVPVKARIPATTRKVEIPPAFAPPSGMCRIWIDDVPASRQPAPTDCASAVKNRPLNSRVIFGDDKTGTAKAKRAKHEDDSPL